MKYAVYRLFDQHTARALINISLTIAFAWMASLWINLGISRALTELPGYQPPVQTGGRQDAMRVDYSIIKRRNIFNPSGTRTKAAALAMEKQVSAQPTTLNLKLIGTVISERGQQNYAVIQDNVTKEQKLYAVDDEVAADAVIVRIDRFKVIIDNAGRTESIFLDFESIFPGGKSPTRRVNTPPSAGGVRADGSGNVTMDRRFLEKQLANMNDVLTHVRAVPHKDKKGNMVGFKLFQIKRGSIFDKIGLKNQDVIQNINGQKLDSVEKGLDLFAALRDETHFTVDLLRNNAKQSLTIDVQ